MKVYENYFIIGFGLGGGFGGIHQYEVVKSKSLNSANDEAYQRSIEEYESYVGSNGIRDIDEIMEDDGVDYDEATQIFNDEREDWLDYEAFPFTREKELEIIDSYHYTNSYEEEIKSKTNEYL